MTASKLPRVRPLLAELNFAIQCTLLRCNTGAATSTGPISRTYTHRGVHLLARPPAKTRLHIPSRPGHRPPTRVTRSSASTSSRAQVKTTRKTTVESSSSKHSAAAEAQTIDTVFQQRKWPLLGAGFVALGLGLYLSMLISSLAKAPPCGCGEHAVTDNLAWQAQHQQKQQGLDPAIPTGRPRDLDQEDVADATARQTTAEAFDRGLEVPERVTGIARLRRRLAAQARGHVLEVAVGTGRNLPLYDWAEAEGAGRADGDGDGNVLSFTGVDISADMLGVARGRLRESVPGLKRIMHRRRVEPMPSGSGTVVDVLDGRVRLVLADAHEPFPSPSPGPGTGLGPGPGPGPSAKYDTIVQTFGLCSVADPAKLLANMASAVRPDTGRILLLEHGRGTYDWLNRGVLDRLAAWHFRKYGCWWNRDIVGLVREAARAVPGLELVSIERPLLFHFGTTMLVELRVRGDHGDPEEAPGTSRSTRRG